jgi:pimeloyl-ACP methyl ester carboxylesterase
VASVASADGTRIFYEVAGGGTPLILSSATFSTHRHWVEAQETLSRRLRVVTWDYRGHGRSEAPEAEGRYSLARLLDDLRAVHEAAAGGSPAVLGGLSLGGTISLS